MHSFFGEVVEFVADVEEPLSESSKFVASNGVFQLKTKHAQHMAGGGDGVANREKVSSRPGFWTRGPGQETQQIRSQDIPFDH